MYVSYEFDQLGDRLMLRSCELCDGVGRCVLLAIPFQLNVSILSLQV